MFRGNDFGQVKSPAMLRASQGFDGNDSVREYRNTSNNVNQDRNISTRNSNSLKFGVRKTNRKSARPSALPVNPDGIPQELKDLDQWVCWKYEPKKNKPREWTKVPIIPKTINKKASSTDPNTWASYNDAYRTYINSRGQLDGIGFVLTGDDPYTVIDLDGCASQSEDGKLQINKQARGIVRQFDSFTYLSASGTGLHVWIKAKKPQGACTNSKPKSTGDRVETYDSGRFFIVTGARPRVRSGERVPIKSRQQELDDFVAEYLTPQNADVCALQSQGALARALPKWTQSNSVFDIRDHTPQLTLHKTSSDQNYYDCPACNGAGKLAVKKSTGAYRCFHWDNGTCTKEAIREAFGIPIRKRATWAENSNSLNSEDVPLGNILEAILAKLSPLPLLANESLPVRVVMTVDAVLSTAEGLGYGFRRYKESFNYVYNGQYWYLVEEGMLKLFLGRAAKALGIPVVQARYIDFIEKLVKQFESQTYYPELGERKGAAVNFRNGTLEFPSGIPKLREFRKDDFLIYQLHFDYDPKAKAPMFQKFLDEILPDKTLQMVCAEFFASCFVDLKLEKMLVPYGTGSNGKGTLLDIVCNVFGRENVSTVSLTELSARNGEYYRTKLVGKLLNYSSEIASRIESSEILKKLVSGEPIQARHPGGDAFEITKTPRFTFNCNILPKDVEQTDAYFRRFLIVPFEQKVYLKSDPHKPAGCLVRDDTLVERISEQESAGVLNWILEGLQRLVANREFTYSETSERIVEKYREDADSARQFIKEFEYRKPTPLDQPQYTLADHLYIKYREFCLKSGNSQLGRNNFYNRLEGMGFQKSKTAKGQVFYIVTDKKAEGGSE